MGLTRDGHEALRAGPALYIRPMYWAEDGRRLRRAARPGIDALGASRIYEAPMPPPTGFSITLSPFRRPTLECMPVDAKAGCLYPNNARALIEARSRGFDNAWCATCWATSPSSPHPTSSWSRTASC